MDHYNNKYGNVKQAILQLKTPLLASFFSFFFLLFLLDSAIRHALIKQQAPFGSKLLLDTDQTAQTHMQTEVQPEPT